MINSKLTKRWFFGRSCVTETNRIQRECGWFIPVSMVWWVLAGKLMKLSKFLESYIVSYLHDCYSSWLFLTDWSGVYFSSHDLHIISHLWKCDCTCFFFFFFWKLIKKPYYFYLWIDPFHVLWESEVIIDWFELFNYLVHHFDHYFLIFFKRVIIFVNTFQVQITWGRLENSLVQSDQNNNGEDMCQTDFVE